MTYNRKKKRIKKIEQIYNMKFSILYIYNDSYINNMKHKKKNIYI